MHVRTLIASGALLFAAGLFRPAYASDAFADRIDRPGGDYKNFDTKGRAASCKDLCENEGAACKAWTWVRPGVQGASARCWLKNTVPLPQRNDCCVSGVRQVYTY